MWHEYPKVIKALHSNRKRIKTMISQGKTFQTIAKELGLAELDVKAFIRYNQDLLLPYRKAQQSLASTQCVVLGLTRQGLGIDAIAAHTLLYRATVLRIKEHVYEPD